MTPAVAFHPGALTLSSGSGAERRRLLDRISLYASPASAEAAASYGRAQRARQRVLSTWGDRSSDLDGWEALMVQHGRALREARTNACAALVPAAEAAFERIGSPG